MKTIRILFMAASTRICLLERFYSAAKDLGIRLEVFDFENNIPWHTSGLSGLAKLVPAPVFSDLDFTEFISNFVKENQIDIVIPIIDKAMIALARAAPKLKAQVAMPVVSGLEECEIMTDKVRSDTFFRKAGLNVPSTNKFPLLAKPRLGASSKGIINLKDQKEFDFWRKRNKAEDFMIQSFITGKEYSVDAYIDSKSTILGIVSRTRIAVSGGEVMVTITEHNDDIIFEAEKLLKIAKWYGPMTIQYIHDGKKAWLIECNPRFGGGVTCSIEAGLSIPEWILRERLGLTMPKDIISWRNGLCMTRARKDYFLWL